MKKFIRYLYEYQNGRRVRSAGFVKVEESGDGTALQIYGKGFPVTGQSVEILLFYLMGKQVVGIPAATARSDRPMFGYHLKYTPENVGGEELYREVDGVILRAGEPRCQWFAAAWRDPAVDVERMILREELLRETKEDEEKTAEGAAEPGSIKDEAKPEPVESESASLKAGEQPGSTETESAPCAGKPVEIGEPSCADEDEKASHGVASVKSEEKPEASLKAGEQPGAAESESSPCAGESVVKIGESSWADKDEMELPGAAPVKAGEKMATLLMAGEQPGTAGSESAPCAGELVKIGESSWVDKDGKSTYDEIPTKGGKEPESPEEDAGMAGEAACTPRAPREAPPAETPPTGMPPAETLPTEASPAGTPAAEESEPMRPHREEKAAREEQAASEAKDRGDVRFRKISRQDLAQLPRREWKLANNHFLLHGCRNYHHLLLLQQNGRLWLGVPGIYHPMEQRAAAAFGFGQFLLAGEIGVAPEEDADQPEFGYWCRPVSGSLGR